MKGWQFLIFFCAVPVAAAAQSFEVDQVEQLFRPRLKMDSRYVFDTRFTDTTGMFNNREASAVFTFPLRTRVSADVKLDLSSLKLKDIIKNSVRFKASQVCGVVRLNGRQTTLGFDTLPKKNMGGITLGLLGLKLTRKYRVMFWSAGLNISEQDRSVNSMVPRATALIGQLHVRGIRKNFFYGLLLSYSDQYVLPIPFFGGSQPIGEKFVFNYTLPAQLNLQYRNDKKLMITAGVNVDGFRSGIIYSEGRANLNYAAAMGYLNIRYKFSRTLIARMEGGYIAYQSIRYSNTELARTLYMPGTGPYVQAGFSVLFGRSIWEKIMENIAFGN